MGAPPGGAATGPSVGAGASGGASDDRVLCTRHRPLSALRDPNEREHAVQAPSSRRPLGVVCGPGQRRRSRRRPDARPSGTGYRGRLCDPTPARCPPEARPSGVELAELGDPRLPGAPSEPTERGHAAVADLRPCDHHVAAALGGATGVRRTRSSNASTPKTPGLVSRRSACAMATPRRSRSSPGASAREGRKSRTQSGRTSPAGVLARNPDGPRSHRPPPFSKRIIPPDRHRRRRPKW